MWQLKGMNLQTALLETSPVSHWQSVLSRVRPSQEQKEQILACYELCEKQMEQVIVQRRQLAKVRVNLRDMEQRFPGCRMMSLCISVSSRWSRCQRDRQCSSTWTGTEAACDLCLGSLSKGQLAETCLWI